MTDNLIADILRGMGVDRSKPPHWMPNVDRLRDQRTGEVIREYHRGYLCSYCGKHSWGKEDRCDGCNSVMQGRENDA